MAPLKSEFGFSLRSLGVGFVVRGAAYGSH